MSQQGDPDIAPLLALKEQNKTVERDAFMDASATTKYLIQQWDVL